MPVLTRLKEVREGRFLTQRELAERSGVSRVSIVRLEGGGMASIRSTRKLAAALGVEPAELIN